GGSGPSTSSGPTSTESGPSTSSGRSSTGSGSIAGWGPTRLARFAAGLYRQTLVDPIEQGRLRGLAWPYGLRAIVLVGYIIFVIAGLLVIFSSLNLQYTTTCVSCSG